MHPRKKFWEDTLSFEKSKKNDLNILRIISISLILSIEMNLKKRPSSS